MSTKKKVLLLSSLAFVSMAVVVGVLVWSFVNRQLVLDKLEGVFTLNDPDPAIVEELQKNLNYVSGQAGDAQYYSPSLDAVLTIDQTKYLITENNNGSITFSEQGIFDLAQPKVRLSIIEGQTVDEAVTAHTDYLEAIHDDTEMTEPVELESGLTKVEYTYTTTNIFTDETYQLTSTQYVKELEDGKLVQAIVGENASAIGLDLAAIEVIVNSVSTDVSELDDQVKLGFADVPGVSFAYGRREWLKSVSIGSSATFSYKSDDFEESLTVFNINVLETSIEQNEEALKASFDSLIEYYNEIGTAEVLAEDYGYDLSGREWYRTVYKANSGSSDLIHESFYTYDETLGVEIKAQITYQEGVSESVEAARGVLGTLEIDESAATEGEDTALANLFSGNVLGSNTLDVEKSAVIGQMATERIFNRTCVTVSITDAQLFPQVAGQTHEYCTAGTGSGFYVNNSGELITNAHVANPNPTDLVVSGFFEDDSEFSNKLYEDILDILFATAPENLTYDQFSSYVLYMVANVFVQGPEQGVLTLSEPKIENYLLSEAGIQVNRDNYQLINASEHTKVELKAANDLESVFEYIVNSVNDEQAEYQITVADLALLSGADSPDNKVVIDLANEAQLNVGSEIFVVGFPGAADNSTLFGDSASNISTITQGSVSAIKPNASQQFNLVQIDASTSHGNSGGPILNSEGELVAVLTYGATESGSADFNYGVSVGAVKSFMESNGSKAAASDVSSKLENGLEYLQLNYYQWAERDLNYVAQKDSLYDRVLNPIVQYVSEKVGTGEDQTPLISVAGIDIQKAEAFIIGGGVFVAVGSMGILVLMLKGKGKNKGGDSAMPETPAPGTPSMQPAPVQSVETPTAAATPPAPAAPAASPMTAQPVTSSAAAPSQSAAAMPKVEPMGNPAGEAAPETDDSVAPEPGMNN